MINNKIIRRHGILKADLYDRLTEDLCELFSGFQGVSCSETEDPEEVDPTYTVISFDTNGKLYIKIEQNATQGAVVSVHLGNGNTLGRDYYNLDVVGTATSSMVSYSFARTEYGGVFSIMSYSDSSDTVLSDAQLRCFFSTFTDEEGHEYYGLVYCNRSGSDSVNTLSIRLATVLHEGVETISGGSLFVGELANQNVLCNAFSYSEPIVAPRLYKKLQTEGAVYGKVKIGGKALIAGSAFALEFEEE